MAFWDELGQKITKGSQGALQKTRDMASVVSLNADISDSRNRIQDLYTELGELLSQERFARGDREELQRMIDADPAKTKTVELENWKEIFARILSIRAEEEKMAQSQDRIVTLRNETKCPNCGTKITKGTFFCPQCGTKIVWPAPVPEAAPAPEAEAAQKAGTEPEAAPAPAPAQKAAPEAAPVPEQVPAKEPAPAPKTPSAAVNSSAQPAGSQAEPAPEPAAAAAPASEQASAADPTSTEGTVPSAEEKPVE